MTKNRKKMDICALADIISIFQANAESLAVVVITEKDLYAALKQANRGEITTIII